MKRVGSLVLVGMLAWSAAMATTAATSATAQESDSVSDDADSGVGLVEIDDGSGVGLVEIDDADSGVGLVEIDDADSGVGLVEINDAALEPAEPFDGRATESTVRRARLVLLAIAGVMTVALAAFWWHTIPLRRLRIAGARSRRSHPGSATDPEGSTAVDRD